MGDTNLNKIDHVVVLMMENRSFDNLLGYLYENGEPQRFIGRGEKSFRGVAGRDDLWNPNDEDPPRRIEVGKAPYEKQKDMCNPSPDPGEFYTPHVNCQIYGHDKVPGNSSELPDPAPMDGFVRDYIRSYEKDGPFGHKHPTYEQYRVIMDSYPPEALPVISTLAREFGVSDEWFASVPSQTFCNRSFLHSGQSRGFVTNSDYIKWRKNKAPTIFERLSGKFESGKDWRLYWDHEDHYPITQMIHPGLDHSKHSGKFRDFKDFATDCESGDLPAYTFIQPRLILNHNDMHPPVWLNMFVHSSLLAGELLINDVYNAVRTGKKWDRTLMMILFDEHGGCYDHSPPPTGITPPVENPDYRLEEGFEFDRFGVRVPAIFVSPYVHPGTVVRAEGGVPFDHTSLIKTLCNRWDLEGLTDRDGAAPDFSSVLSLSESEARHETPECHPRAYTNPHADHAHAIGLTGFQKDFVGLVSHRLGKEVPGVLHSVGDALKHLAGKD